MPTCGQEMPISKPHNCFISGLNYFLKCELNFGNFRKPFTSYLPSPASVSLRRPPPTPPVKLLSEKWAGLSEMLRFSALVWRVAVN